MKRKTFSQSLAVLSDVFILVYPIYFSNFYFYELFSDLQSANKNLINPLRWHLFSRAFYSKTPSVGSLPPDYIKLRRPTGGNVPCGVLD